MLAFHDTQSAVAWACAVQAALLELPWADRLLSLPGFGPTSPPEIGRSWGEMNFQIKYIFRGLKIQMGIEYGLPSEIIPHRSTGRADYFGTIVNTTARIAKAANGGQIIIGQRAWAVLCMEGASFLQSFHYSSDKATSEDIYFSELGQYRMKGISGPTDLVQVLPASLLNRSFPKPKAPPYQQTTSTLGESALNPFSTIRRRSHGPDSPWNTPTEKDRKRAPEEKDVVIEVDLNIEKPEFLPRRLKRDRVDSPQVQSGRTRKDASQTLGLRRALRVFGRFRSLEKLRRSSAAGLALRGEPLELESENQEENAESIEKDDSARIPSFIEYEDNDVLSSKSKLNVDYDPLLSPEKERSS